MPDYLPFADKQVTGNDSLIINVVPLVLTANNNNTANLGIPKSCFGYFLDVMHGLHFEGLMKMHVKDIVFPTQR